ncbi:hypothetical protein SESBI_34666, partial [Sesbania bispinosa]
RFPKAISHSISGRMDNQDSETESIFDSSETEALSSLPQPNRRSRANPKIVNDDNFEVPVVNVPNNEPILIEDHIDIIAEVDREN